MDKNILGDYLRQLRLDKDVTTRRLGEKINYSYSYIASMEKGRRNITNDFLEKYIYALSESKDELINIKKEISKITKGAFYKEYFINSKNKKSDSMLAAFLGDNGTNNMFSEEQNLIVDKNYNFPINDISFHLSDKYNNKFFKSVKLSDEDRNYMNTLFYNHLKQKYDYKLIDVTNRINEKTKIFDSLKKDGLTDKEIFVREDLAILHDEEFEIQRVLALLERPMSYFE